MSEVRRQIAYKRTNILRFLSKAAGHSSPSNRHATVKQDLESGTIDYLSTDLRQPDLSYSRFRQSLKTFLFGQWAQSAV